MEQSLSEYIANSRTDEGVLPEGFKLPERTKEDGIPFADGALDGITIYHMGHTPFTEDEKKELGSLLDLACNGEEKEAEEEECKEFYRNAFDAVRLFCVIGAVMMVLFKDLIVLVLGSNYRGAEKMIPFLTLMPVFAILFEITNQGLKISRKNIFLNVASFSLISFSIFVISSFVFCNFVSSFSIFSSVVVNFCFLVA